MSKDRTRVTRRDVLKGAGAAALVGAIHGATAEEARAAPGIRTVGPGAAAVELKVNGKAVRLDIEPRVTLLDALRDRPIYARLSRPILTQEDR